jgi:hypothetical protein
MLSTPVSDGRPHGPFPTTPRPHLAAHISAITTASLPSTESRSRHAGPVCCVAAVLLLLPMQSLTGQAPQSPAVKSVKVTTTSDGSQLYSYPSGLTCLKRADYAKVINAAAALKIKEIFALETSYQTKLDNVKKLSPSFQELDASFFDFCTQYAQGLITKDQYTEDRNAFNQIRRDLIKHEIELTTTFNQQPDDKPSPVLATSTATPSPPLRPASTVTPPATRPPLTPTPHLSPATPPPGGSPGPTPTAAGLLGGG